MKKQKNKILNEQSSPYLPQLNKPFNQIVDGLKQENIQWRPVIVRIGQLNPLQKTIEVSKMQDFSQKIKDSGEYNMDPLFISNDDHILDGHHRAAGLIHSLGKDSKIKCIRIDLDKDNGVRMLNKVSDRLEFEEQHKKEQEKNKSQVENKNVLRFNKKQLEEYAKQVIENNLEEYDLNESDINKSYFIDPHPDRISKAEKYGLIDIENKDLTPEGLIAKMIEWDEGEHGVEAYIYDMTKEQLEKQGYKMPDEIRRISDDEDLSHGSDFPHYRLNEDNDDLEDDFNINDIEPGDLVNFGPYGRLYVIKTGEDKFWVTDRKEDRFDENASGWFINKSFAKKIIKKGNDEGLMENDLEEGPRTHSELRRQKIKSYPEKQYSKSRMRPYERKKYYDISENNEKKSDIDTWSQEFDESLSNIDEIEANIDDLEKYKKQADIYVNTNEVQRRINKLKIKRNRLLKRHKEKFEKELSEDKINRYLQLKEKYNVKNLPSEELSLEEQDKFMEELINIKENIPNNKKKVRLNEKQFTEMISNIKNEYAQAGLPIGDELPSL